MSDATYSTNFRFTVVVSEDPLAGDVDRVNFRHIAFSGSSAAQAPAFANPGAFRGALLIVGFLRGSHVDFIGTACIIAPGLAVSATHIFADHTDDLKSGVTGFHAFGISGSESSYWHITSVTYHPDDDLALLSLAARSPLPTDATYYQFPITTRAVLSGEVLEIFGFRKVCYEHIDEMSAQLSLNLLGAKGTVTSTSPRGRGRYSFPVIEIQAGSLGGMSGGVALTQDGYLVGVISGGLTTEDQLGPTYVSWVVKCLGRATRIIWPKGLYKTEVSILDIDPRFVLVEGRDKVRSLGGYGDVEVEIWFKNPDAAPPGN